MTRGSSQERPWWQSWLSWCAVLTMMIGMLQAVPVGAEEARSPKESRADCRFEGIGMEPSKAAGSAPLEAFPENDVFRPLLADPKQPQFFAAWQATRVRTNDTSVNVGSVGFGEDFGVVGRRDGCNGWQIGILGGVFAQFNMDAPSIDLVNADYVIGFPVSWRHGLFSTRLRVYHQSSHLGDEFLLGNPGFPRVNLSYEAVEAIVSLDAPGGWGRIYAGGSTLFHRAPATLDRNGVQWGAELRGPAFTAARLRLIPVLGADFKAFEELHWIINANVVGGLEWSRPGSDRRIRLLLNYYHGFSPYGQFFSQKVETVGFGLYLSF
jgi:hypothetical protein